MGKCLLAVVSSRDMLSLSLGTLIDGVGCFKMYIQVVLTGLKSADLEYKKDLNYKNVIDTFAVAKMY